MPKFKANLTQEALKALLTYDPDTGDFVSIDVRAGRKGVGNKVGYKAPDGYIRVGVAGKYFSAHRLAFLYMTGRWPSEYIDHVNGTKDDNRWLNLREATGSQNNRNKKVNSKNQLGIKGVSSGRDGRFRVYICLGTYSTAEEAKSVYDRAAKELHGEFYKT